MIKAGSRKQYLGEVERDKVRGRVTRKDSVLKFMSRLVARRGFGLTANAIKYVTIPTLPIAAHIHTCTSH